MPRYSFTFKARNVRSQSGGRQQNTTFLWCADDDAAIALGAALAPLSNGTLVSINKQLQADPTNGNGPYGDALANGGSSVAKCLARNTDREIQTFVIPFAKDGTSKQAIETALEPVLVGVLNQFEHPIGNIVNVQFQEIVDG